VIEGYSGCSIEIQSPLLIKSNLSYPAERLYQQGLKQFRAGSYPGIVIPKVHNLLWEQNHCEIIMDYYPAMDSISFLETATIPDIDRWLSIILGFIQENIKNSTIGPANHRLFETSIDIELGQNHGDLTLSNILWYQQKVVLIDFLDGFESPLIDIAKLRQDTKYRWSFFLSGRINKRLEIVLDYLDNEILAFGQQYETYRKYGTMLERLCLQRILPYSKEPAHRAYIENCLCQP